MRGLFTCGIVVLLALALTGCGGESTFHGPPPAPIALLSNTGLSFAAQLVGTSSVAQTVVLTNAGNASLNISSVAASGDYGQTNNCGTSLPAQGQCSINVTFTPTDGGTRTGDITIGDDAPGSPQIIKLTGAASVVSVPSSLSFGPQNVGTTSGQQTVLVTNLGTAALNIIGIFASGDFAETNNCGTSLPAKSSCSIRISFSPSAAGNRLGSLTLNDTDVTTMQVSGLSGVGRTPASTVSITPHLTSLTFTQTSQFTATGGPVNWSVDGVADGDSTVGTISTQGVYTPPSTAGSHIVMATSAADPTQTASAQVIVTDYAGVFTYHNDNARTGQNLNETVLTTGNVNQAQFGKLFSYPVDGQIYAQPLYIENLSIPGKGFHNVVFVATEHDSVYAFDADGGGLIWQVSFINPAAGVTPVADSDVGSSNITPEIGITGTPVIDAAAKTLYVVVKTKEASGMALTYVQRLHALDLTTGADRFAPVAIQASVAGTGDGNNGSGTVFFDPLRQNQRPGLLLMNGVIYISWASHGDVDPYHGWVIGYASGTLAQGGVFNDSPNGSRAGIWQSGGAPAADGVGNIYFLTGNGTFDANNAGGLDFGDSVIKLSASVGLSLADYFTPFDQDSLNVQDNDLGSSGCIVLPDQPTSPVHLLVTSGKSGTIYLLDRDNMGKFHAGDNSQIVQSIPSAVGGVWGNPAYWQNFVYVGGQYDVLKVFRLFNGLLSTSPVSQTGTVFGYPGPTPSISANGASNGIVWALQNEGFGSSSPTILHAFDAADVSVELYNSTQAPTRDALGGAVKFTVPTIANGKVYVGTQAELDVLGILQQ